MIGVCLVKVKANDPEASSLKNSAWRLICFLRYHARDIRRGGLPVLLRKAQAFLMMVLAVPVVLPIRALRSLVLIRFGQLISHRIGHFAVNTELYLCERDAGLYSPRTIDIFYHTSPVSNQQLKKMWDRSTLRVSRLARLIDSLNRRLPGYQKHIVLRTWPGDRDIYGLLARTPVHISFTPKEERQGLAALQRMGIVDSAPFVCFLARDSAYLSAASPNKDWSYHDYRDSNIHNFILAVEELTRRGYFAIRMGSIVKEALNTVNPKIIDYATRYRTVFLDIFLGAKCHFYIGDSCGFWAIAMIFKRPGAIVNMIPFEWAPTWSSDCLIIPKKLWLRQERRFLTFREIFDSDIGGFCKSQQYEQFAIEVVQNTPEEIAALAVEMDERLKRTWHTTEEDEELQQRFWSLFKPSKLQLHGTIVSRIGAEFLRQNKELLE